MWTDFLTRLTAIPGVMRFWRPHTVFMKIGPTYRYSNVRPVPCISVWEFRAVAFPVTERIVVAFVILLLHLAPTNRANWLSAGYGLPELLKLRFHRFDCHTFVDQASPHYFCTEITHVIPSNQQRTPPPLSRRPFSDSFADAVFFFAGNAFLI